MLWLRVPIFDFHVGLALAATPPPHTSSALSGPAADGTKVHDTKAAISASAAVTQDSRRL